MADLGNGTSRTLSAAMRQFQLVVYQRGKPPLDSEHNLLQQIQNETVAQWVRSQMSSGFFLDPTRPLDAFVTDPLNANQFRYGQQKRLDTSVEELAPIEWANVNGWLVPVVGTNNAESGATDNIVALNPPPDSDSRIDFVFLEVWRVNVAPNDSTANKPSADKIYTYGNVEFGQTNINDDLTDPAIGFETTERVQLQYRIRVVGQGSGAGVSPALDVYPDGLDDPNVRAQGPLTGPSAQAYAVWENMREELGDPSLWRAGDGDPANDFGTIDGYVWAIPMCGIFRRNNQPYVAVNQAGNPNQNGAFNRTPSSALLTDPRDGARLLTTAALVDDMPGEQFSVLTEVEVDGLVGSGFDDDGISFTNTFMVIDDEVIAIDSIDTTVNPARVRVPANGRGQWGSDPTFHSGREAPVTPGTGTSITFFNTRPDGKFADEIHLDDVFDMRRGVNFGDWDYERLLLHNVSALMQNRLRSTWKQTGVPSGDTEGVTVHEVDYLLQDGATAVPNGTEAMDGPDGIRTIFSDAATMQSDVTTLLDNDGTMNDGFIQTFDDLVFWDAGADFKPGGFMNNLNNTTPGFKNGTTIFQYIGGDSGNVGARKTFRDGSTRAVRFLMPKEHFVARQDDPDTGRQRPVTLRWVSSDNANTGTVTGGAGLQALTPAAFGEAPSEHPGPMYPLSFLNFEKPFIVLGGIVESSLNLSGIASATLHDNITDAGTIPPGEGEIELPGFDFDALNDWFTLDSNGEFELAPEPPLSFPLLRGQRTLYDMITAGGRDRTGSSSELYLILYGDIEAEANNGAFQVIGAGTGGMTQATAGGSNRLRVRFLSQGVTTFDTTSTDAVSLQVRSMYSNAEDGLGQAGGPSAMTITLTDIEALEGGAANPWNEANINPFTIAGRTLAAPFNEKCVANLTLQYHPGRGATARVPDQIERVAIQQPNVSLLRQSAANLDTDFPNATGAPGAPPEVDFTPTHIQVWNRLAALGQHEPYAPNYGGNVVLFSEIDRENEAFIDRGSKTLLLRPYQDLGMTMQGFTTFASPSLLGPTGYPAVALIPNGWDGPKDDAAIFTPGLAMGYVVPQEFMPRFGRQDIPFYQDQGPTFGTGRFLAGINHLFTDGTDLTNPVFNVIGGGDNSTGGTLVTRFLAQTGSTSGFLFGQYGTVTGPTTPAYQGRLLSAIGTTTALAEEITNRIDSVVSSDFGVGIDGIQLPPYIGISRLVAVYDRRDYVGKGGVSFDTDRVTPLANRAVNLLRKDADKQTLFILQDGARDLTGGDDDHTYVVPSNAIDITRSPNYVADEEFSDLEYVVEFTAFGFARGFINKNNFVMARRHNGVGATIADGDNPELENIRMTIPHAAPDSSRVYIAYNRTVYQGDPYMSRAGSVRTNSDYEHRYGQIAVSDAFAVGDDIQQYDGEGAQIPERPNARSFEVMASLDFYMTLGTGNIGGRLYPGTVTDVGYTEDNPVSATRIPLEIGSPANRVLARAFSEGQKENTSRGFIDLRIDGTAMTYFPAADATTVTIKKLNGDLVSFIANNGVTVDEDKFDASSPDEVVIAKELTDKIAARTGLADTLVARNDIDDQVIRLVSRVVGAEGNGIRVSITDTVNMSLRKPVAGEVGLDATFTDCFLAGGFDLPVNGGNGTTQIHLTGMTERFPLGILFQDSDFIGENPLGDNASAVQTTLGGIRPVQNLLPLTRSGGEEFTRFAGAPGDLIGMGDGAILQYSAFDEDLNPGGSKRFRLFRGGGSLFVLGGRNPGGPVDYVSGSLEKPLNPVLKGGLLACKALLVRNLTERAFTTADVTTEGDELQMVVVTTGILGDGRTRENGVTLDGVISPTGFGEGEAASDRYRLNGKPMWKGRTRVTPDPATVPLAPFPGRDSE